MMIWPKPTVEAVASTATAVDSISSYSSTLGNYLGISASICVPNLIVFPVSLLMNRFSLIIVYLNISGLDPIEILSGFMNVKE